MHCELKDNKGPLNARDPEDIFLKAAREAKKRERSRFNPIRCIIFFCTNPVARFWLVCNICFVFGLTTFSIIYLVMIFPMMRGLFNY